MAVKRHGNEVEEEDELGRKEQEEKICTNQNTLSLGRGHPVLHAAAAHTQFHVLLTSSHSVPSPTIIYL